MLNFPGWSGSAATRPPFSDPKIERIFKIYKGKKSPTRFYFFLLLNHLATIGLMGVTTEIQTVI
jgi:hypothetical protein